MKKLLILFLLAFAFSVKGQNPYSGNERNTMYRNPMMQLESIKQALLKTWKDNGHTGSYTDFLNWLKGAKGDQGIQGLQGIQGAQGNQGFQGLKGDIGLTGAKGDTGLKGETGSSGIQGAKGDVGLKGDQGIQGVQGLTGQSGLNGLQGIQGIQGPKGDKGEKGEVGSQGVPGVVKVAGGSNTLSGTINIIAGSTYSVNVNFTAPLTNTNYVVAVTLNGSLTLLGSITYSGITNKTINGCTVLLKNNGLLSLNIATLTVEVIAFQTS